MFSDKSILGYNEKFFEKEKSEPRFFTDLNLDQIVNRIMGMRKDYDLRRYFYCLPESVSVAKQRVEVLKVLKQETVLNGFLYYSDKMRQSRFYWGKFGLAKTTIQKQRYLLDCGYEYVQAVERLKEVMRTNTLNSVLLEAFGGELDAYVESEWFQEFSRRTKMLAKSFSDMRVRVRLEGDKLRISMEEKLGEKSEDMGNGESVCRKNGHKGDIGGYSERLKKLFPENEDMKDTVDNPFIEEEDIGELELLILEMLQKNKEEVFVELYRYYDNYKTPESILQQGLLIFERQLQVYIAFYLFFEKQGVEYPMAFPEFLETQSSGMCGMEVCSGYDLALYLKRYTSEYQIVCNDIKYNADEKFMVVTGPNQGGKTTYARSIGQIVYFSLMGFMAPCISVKLPFFNGILTHFSVEESMETGRGKLKEELVRLEPMMKGDDRGCFVVINELFTTAATGDAYVMGKNVMEYFMDMDFMGIYVTHIQELADEQQIGSEKNHIVSLVACVDEKNPRLRTYQIKRRKAEGIGYAYGLVEKYKLTYPEMVKRLKEV